MPCDSQPHDACCLSMAIAHMPDLPLTMWLPWANEVQQTWYRHRQRRNLKHQRVVWPSPLLFLPHYHTSGMHPIRVVPSGWVWKYKDKWKHNSQLTTARRKWIYDCTALRFSGWLSLHTHTLQNIRLMELSSQLKPSVMTHVAEESSQDLTFIPPKLPSHTVHWRVYNPI